MKKIIPFICLAGLAGLSPAIGLAADMSLPQVLDKINEHYLPLKSSQIEINKAALESDKIESLLGWQVGAQTGFERDLSFLGTPSDIISAGASASRSLASGDTLSTQLGYRYENAELAFNPLPNPSHSSSIDLSFRRPLDANPVKTNYQQGQNSAAAARTLAATQQALLYDRTAEQAIGLFHGIASLRAAKNNINDAIKRSRRLLSYINKNAKLGLAEDHDQLQVQAQLKTLQAEQRLLDSQLEQQTISLNRLMGRPAHDAITPAVSLKRNSDAIKAISDAAIKHSPQRALLTAQVELANANIERQKDTKQNTLDAVATVGIRSLNGDNTSGTVNEQDIAYMIQLEYRSQHDKRGLDATLMQAKYERLALLDQIKTLEQDIHYRAQALDDQIAAGKLILAAHQARLKTEQKKLRDGRKRHRNGRLDTQQLIMLENDLSIAKLKISQQKIDTANRIAQLSLLQGQIWNVSIKNEGARP